TAPPTTELYSLSLHDALPISNALGVHAQVPRRKAQLDRSTGVGAKELAAGLAVAREHLLARMAEAVAVADGEHREARRHPLHELRRRRGGAAVMGDEERVRRQQRGLAQQKLAFCDALDVSGEQHTATGTFDPQHAAQVIGLRLSARRDFRTRMEEFEGDSIPKPFASR